MCGKTRAVFAGGKKETCSAAKEVTAVRQCAINIVWGEWHDSLLFTNSFHLTHLTGSRKCLRASGGAMIAHI